MVAASRAEHPLPLPSRPACVAINHTDMKDQFGISQPSANMDQARIRRGADGSNYPSLRIPLHAQKRFVCKSSAPGQRLARRPVRADARRPASRDAGRGHALTQPVSALRSDRTAGELARRVSLSQATLTGIFKRLEERGLLERRRDQADRRCVVLRATEAGYNVVAGSPPLLQETFVQRFGQLTAWEQNLLLSSVQRVAELMDAETLEAAPLLSSQSTLDQTD